MGSVGNGLGVVAAFSLASLIAVAGCTTDERGLTATNGSRTISFGPLTVPPGTDDTSNCVALTLGNDRDIFVNEVTLVTGPGFHHSNWLWVPDFAFDGPDGIFKCDDRSYDQAAAGILGGVFFAQSTQAEHETQTFPTGMAVVLPPRSKLVAQIHLVNMGDEPYELEPTIGFQAIPADSVHSRLASVTFEYHPLRLLPNEKSHVSVECDIGPKHMEIFGRPPDFNLYYALAHYHQWGTHLSIEAVKADGASAMIYETHAEISDKLGGRIDPAFSMNGYTKLRLSCDYYNNTSQTLYYGNGKGEMCIFNAFSDSPYAWAGGAINNDDPGPGTLVGDTMTYTHGCQVFAVESKQF